jgi:hypothetical protein
MASRRSLFAAGVQIFAALFLLFAGVCRAQVNSVDVSPDFPYGTTALESFNMDGRIVGLALDPNNNSILYAASEWSGVWKSVDGAHTWVQTSHGLRNGLTREFYFAGRENGVWAYPSLAVDATNSQRLLYATTSKDGRVTGCEGCQFGGLWVSIDGAENWEHVNLCSLSSEPDDVSSVIFSSGRPFVATNCGIWTTTNPQMQTGWTTVGLPNGVSSASGTILASSTYGQTLFACPGSGTRVYRLESGQTWDAGVDVGGTCLGLSAVPIPGESQASTSVVIHTTASPVNSAAGATTGISAVEVTVVNHKLSTTLSLSFANVATFGSGRSGVWAIRRTNSGGGANGPGVSYDVFASDALNYYRYTGNNVWSPPFPMHFDTWWLEFPRAYDGGTGNCTVFAANDSGVFANPANSCSFNGWVGASSGLHVAWGNRISGLSLSNADTSAKLCASSQDGQPCPILFLPTTDDDVFIRAPNFSCAKSNPFGGGCETYGTADYSWKNFTDSLGDAGSVLIDPAQPNFVLACRNGNYNMFVGAVGQLPTTGMKEYNIVAPPSCGSPTQTGTDTFIGIQAPTSEAIKQVLTLPNETPLLRNGDFLALRSTYGTDCSSCRANHNCSNDSIVRNTSAALGLQAAENGWVDISPNAQFGPGQVTGIYPAGGHESTTVYVLTSNASGINYAGTPYQPGKAYKAQAVIGKGISKWQSASGSGICPPSHPQRVGCNTLSVAYNLFVNPYDANELWAIDLGSTPSAIKVSRDGGESWTPVPQLKDIATNYGEFDFTCGAFANGPSNYGDKEIFGNQCSMTEMLFPPGLPNVRFAVLYPGGVAFSGDGGKTWMPLNATNAQASAQPIELPQSAFYDPNVNAAGNSSLYVALEGKGVKRIDAPFASLGSLPNCTSTLSCSGITFGYPSLVGQCPVPVNFYQHAGTPNQELVCDSCQSYTAPTLDLPNAVAACQGQACSYFSTYEASATYCGALPPQSPNFCSDCVKTGGICTTLADGKKVCTHQ